MPNTNNFDDFTSLKDHYNKCTKCPSLCESRNQVVFGTGNPNADVLFIGEAPGANEDKHGIPFCGMSGKILDELLDSINLNRNDIFITNTILCRPPNNRNPKKEEVSNCRERLDSLINVMQPKVIVTIGNYATERITGKVGIKSLRGKPIKMTISEQNILVIPVVHPASYLYSGRNPEELARMKDDFSMVKGIIINDNNQLNLTQF